MTYPTVSPAERAAEARRIADRFARNATHPARFSTLPCCGLRIDATQPIPPAFTCPDCGTGWDGQYRDPAGVICGHRIS